MKRLLVLMVAVSCLFCGCGKSAEPLFPKGDEVRADFTVEMSGISSTKATIDNDGLGVHADRCKMQIWWKGVLFCERTVDINDFKAKFSDIILIKDETYDFLFWADNNEGSYYKTDTLMAVRLTGDYIGGNDRRDAFFGAIADKFVGSSFKETITLRRPFSQLNVIATDIPEIYAQIPDKSQFPRMVPDSISLSITVPTVFNVKDSTATVPKTLTYGSHVYTRPYKTDSTNLNTLSMDYFYAPVEEGNVADITYKAINRESGMKQIDYTFTNIPLRRNYRTNIVGKVLSNVAEIDVIIDPVWDEPEYTEEF